MLRPQDGPTRESKNLDGLWRFRLDPAGAGRDGEWWRAPLAESLEMPVPASYNDVLADAEVRDHVGEVWYQTTARVPRGWTGQRVVLRFDSATTAPSSESTTSRSPGTRAVTRRSRPTSPTTSVPVSRSGSPSPWTTG